MPQALVLLFSRAVLYYLPLKYTAASGSTPGKLEQGSTGIITFPTGATFTSVGYQAAGTITWNGAEEGDLTTLAPGTASSTLTSGHDVLVLAK